MTGPATRNSHVAISEFYDVGTLAALVLAA